VRERATADRVVASASERHGQLDVFVNNAAIDHTGDVLETPIEEIRALFDVAVFGAIHIAAGRGAGDAGTRRRDR
jgi:NAD(P)-dependent dehydrogenase (short-subunit alcohol dehydrogenase family)